jgi:hypothetical protein
MHASFSEVKWSGLEAHCSPLHVSITEDMYLHALMCLHDVMLKHSYVLAYIGVYDDGLDLAG